MLRYSRIAQFRYYSVQGQFDAALEHYGPALETKPNDSWLLMYIGMAHRDKELWGEAATELMNASRLDRTSSIKATEAAWTLMQLRRFSEADTFVAVAVDADRVDPWVYLLKARLALVQDGNLDRALEIFRDAVRRFGPVTVSGEDHEFLGPLLASQEPSLLSIFLEADFSDALFEAAGRRHSRLATLYQMSGDAGAARVQFDSTLMAVTHALAVMDEAAAGGRYGTELRIRLALAQAGLGQFDASVKLVRDLLEGRRNWTGRVSMTRVLVMAGQHAEAISLLAALLDEPSSVTSASLRVNPWWDELRDYPESRP